MKHFLSLCISIIFFESIHVTVLLTRFIVINTWLYVTDLITLCIEINETFSVPLSFSRFFGIYEMFDVTVCLAYCPGVSMFISHCTGMN